MSKVSISALASVLVEKSGLSQQDAELFIKKMFDVANLGLETDKQVKMRWLGTFKVTAVKDRESVDVNTGERIVIEGRDKITFTPDSILKEIVNKPFAQFETVVVNDGVDFDAIDKKFEADAAEETSDVVESTPEVVKEALDVVEIKTPDEPVSQPSDSPSDEVIVVGEPQPIETSAETVSPVNEEPSVEEEAPKEETLEEKPLEEHETSGEESPKEENPEEESPKEETLEEESPEEESSKRHVLVPRYVVVMACVVLATLMGGIGWFAFHYGQMTTQRNQLAMQLSAFQQMSKKASIAKKPSLSQEELMRRKAMEDSVRLAQASEAIKMAEKAKRDSARKVAEAKEKQAADLMAEKKAEKKAEKEKAVADLKAEKAKVEQSKYDQDARVRTGAYRIVGVAQVVTVKGNQSIASISSKYLGPGMECYVEALNGSGSVKDGQKIKIPKLELKKKKQ